MKPPRPQPQPKPRPPTPAHAPPPMHCGRITCYSCAACEACRCPSCEHMRGLCSTAARVPAEVWDCLAGEVDDGALPWEIDRAVDDIDLPLAARAL